MALADALVGTTTDDEIGTADPARITRFAKNLTATPEVVRAHHRALIEAIQAKDAEKAAKVADDHLRSGAELAARMGGRSELQPQPLPAA